MKQAIIFAKEIKRKQEAVERTKSNYLKNDYSKSIYADIQELYTYCQYRDIDFADVARYLADRQGE